MPKIISKIYDQIIAHAQLEAPNECCGLLAGITTSADRTPTAGAVSEREGVVTHIYLIQNLPSDDPRIIDLNIPSDRRVRYMMDPGEQFCAIRNMREKELTLMGIYHSHPHSVAYPSATDLRLAFYSDLFYLIISLAQNPPDLRAFWIVDQKIAEEGVEMISDLSHSFGQ